MGRGGSSSGSTLDNESRGPGFDSCWELGFFSLSSLSSLSISSASLIKSFREVQHNLYFKYFQKKKMEDLAVQLEAKQTS